jgi:hypothetical protein
VNGAHETDRALHDALRRLAGDDAALGAAPHVEAALLAQVRALASTSTGLQPPAAGRPRWTAYIAAAAAIVFVMLVWRFVPSHPPAMLASISGSLEEPPLGDFLPLPYAHVPTQGGQVVRMTVPRAALTSFGFDPGNPGGPDAVLADVFVGTDGLARAVRFVGPDLREELHP